MLSFLTATIFIIVNRAQDIPDCTITENQGTCDATTGTWATTMDDTGGTRSCKYYCCNKALALVTAGVNSEYSAFDSYIIAACGLASDCTRTTWVESSSCGCPSCPTTRAPDTTTKPDTTAKEPATTACTCITQYDPQCCNGKDYTNGCRARCAGCDNTNIVPGACGSDTTKTPETTGCNCITQSDPQCCNGKDYTNGCRARCDGCDDTNIKPGTCGSDTTSAPDTTEAKTTTEQCTCPKNYDPVCCGGVSYDNDCFAECAGCADVDECSCEESLSPRDDCPDDGNCDGEYSIEVTAGWKACNVAGYNAERNGFQSDIRSCVAEVVLNDADFDVKTAIYILHSYMEEYEVDTETRYDIYIQVQFCGDDYDEMKRVYNILIDWGSEFGDALDTCTSQKCIDRDSDGNGYKYGCSDTFDDEYYAAAVFYDTDGNVVDSVFTGSSFMISVKYIAFIVGLIAVFSY